MMNLRVNPKQGENQVASWYHALQLITNNKSQYIKYLFQIIVQASQTQRNKLGTTTLHKHHSKLVIITTREELVLDIIYETLCQILATIGANFAFDQMAKANLDDRQNYLKRGTLHFSSPCDKVPCKTSWKNLARYRPPQPRQPFPFISQATTNMSLVSFH